LKFGLRSSTSWWFGSYFVNLYAPVPGSSAVPASLFGVPTGRIVACGTAILSSHSASGRVRWNVTVFAFGSTTTPLERLQVAGVLRHASPPTSTL
jgi:hypothetical protein